MLKAEFYLEGGLLTVLEGLRDLGEPCAKVLSVAGFYALLWPFLAGKRFILRVRMVLGGRKRPLSFNSVTKSIKTVTTTRRGTATR